MNRLFTVFLKLDKKQYNTLPRNFHATRNALAGIITKAKASFLDGCQNS